MPSTGFEYGSNLSHTSISSNNWRDAFVIEKTRLLNFRGALSVSVTKLGCGCCSRSKMRFVERYGRVLASARNVKPTIPPPLMTISYEWSSETVAFELLENVRPTKSRLVVALKTFWLIFVII